MTHKWTHRFELKPGRWVFVPSSDAKITGARIKREVCFRWKPPPFYFHLRAGGHVAAIQSHLPSRFFYRADLDDFFGRINRSRVTRCLKQWFSYGDAREMASESVVKRPGLDGFVLPYGFIQSPILASLALDMSKLGSYLKRLNGQANIKVSVYVDDIIISAHDEAILTDVAERLAEAAKASIFPISENKREGPACRITAFNIELAHEMLRITDTRLAKFCVDYQATLSENCKNGIVGYVDSVNRDQMIAFT